jgi:hypothetical protein
MVSRTLRFVALLLCFTGSPGYAQKFFPDDPIGDDHDELPIEPPGEIDISATYDLLKNTFVHDLEETIPRAANANTLGEVPDSSWFTNRIGVRDLSIAELIQGPNKVGPPDTLKPKTIIGAKQAGITAGFTIRDSRSNIYFIKFDPREHPNLSTAADVISKHFFYAIGYNVPENHIVYLSRENLLIDPGAEISLPGGKKAPMDQEYLDFMLDKAAHHPDGSTRAVASLMIEGDLLGPFKFYGTRPDDPNDIFPHEHRRELRGYRVFCAWLNHDDSRSLNTLDTFVRKDEGGFIKHFLIDFGSTLGSGSNQLRQIAPQSPRAGNEYLIEFGPMWKTAYTFGIWERPWMKVKFPYPKYAEIGRIEADFFEPGIWKPEYPNPAFERMLADDGFWAAKIVARFSDEAIRAIVKRGEYLGPESERYLADTLIKRRDKVVSHYYRQLNPLDGFEVIGAGLRFRNLGEEWGLGHVEGYEFQWFLFDNDTEELTPLGEKKMAAQPVLPLPGDRSEYLMVRVRTQCGTEPKWNLAVDVYLRISPKPTIVGIEREI